MPRARVVRESDRLPPRSVDSLRTAYVARPVGDPPTGTDRFDLHADDLAGPADRLDGA
ncbi:hypothetical protein GCM10018785_31360 [Streptomyces longispororuber]|uniref:Uncharacterized protein n=1 Tax=Streptomyces longispororuber TaxID=68230 RepID=A0A919DNI6_9ACTN|nr:hypothetical protein GCM10018785_31360 [Streptomyces longispororuber]